MSLHDKSALVIGAGGLGGPALLTLAAAGVGRLVVVDDDVVDTSNLNRQPLFGEADVGARKAAAAAARLGHLHPNVRVEALDRRFDADDALELVRGVDVVVDGSDNFPTKFLANDAAVKAAKPLVHGGVLRTTLQLLTVTPGLGGCVRCIFEAPPPAGLVPSCAEAGVLGAVAGFAGALMGAEALRVLAGERGAYAARIFIYEARTARTRLVMLRKRADCPTCAGTQVLESSRPAACEVAPGRQAAGTGSAT
jgi:molybdopterin/thiamine biosynthesis adenylyltransferase